MVANRLRKVEEGPYGVESDRLLHSRKRSTPNVQRSTPNTKFIILLGKAARWALHGAER
jgi:hypothetical protein